MSDTAGAKAAAPVVPVAKAVEPPPAKAAAPRMPNADNVQLGDADGGLDSCFKECRVPEALVKHITDVVGAENLSDFVNLFEMAALPEQTTAMVGTTDLAGTPGERLAVARLRTSFQLATKAIAKQEALEQRAAEKKEKDEDDDLDDPLPAEDAREVVDGATTLADLQEC